MKTLLLSGVLLLLLAAPASAAQVLSIDGAGLSATDGRGDELCVRLDRNPETICGAVPARPYRALLTLRVDEERTVIGGAMPVGVARVEGERDDGARFSADTSAGERYRGRHAGAARFFLLGVPHNVPAAFLAILRFYDASGALVGAVEVPSAEGRLGAGPFRLLSQRAKGASSRVVAYTRPTLAPTPLALDRIEPLVCLGVVSRDGNSTGESSGCSEPGPFRAPLDLTTDESCAPLRTTLYGLVGDAVTGVRLRLGSGRSITVKSRALPAPLGRRYVAALIPRGEAVRSAAAVGMDARQPIGSPPSGLPCDPDNSAGTSYGGVDVLDDAAKAPPGPDQQVVAEAGGHRLVARDAEADRLCVGLDGLAADSSDCLLPPVDPNFAPVFAGKGLVHAVLPADVTRVRLPGGREVPTFRGEAYTGRYAGRVSFLLAEVPRGSSRLRYFGADGARLGDGYALLGTLEPSRSAVLARGRDWRLFASRYDGQWCVGLGRSPDDCTFPGDERAAYVRADCGSTPVLFGTAPRGVKRVAVRLRGGKRLQAAVVDVPRRIGSGRVFVLALPRRAEVRRLILGRRSHRFIVLPHARQCGYQLARPFF